MHNFKATEIDENLPINTKLGLLNLINIYKVLILSLCNKIKKYKVKQTLKYKMKLTVLLKQTSPLRVLISSFLIQITPKPLFLKNNTTVRGNTEDINGSMLFQQRTKVGELAQWVKHLAV